jgi:Zn-dependent membrane protease YugP
MFGIIILFVIIGFIVQQRLKSKFKKYSKEALSNGMSGAEIAQKMLEDHFIYDVRIESVAGKLTDHLQSA